MQPRFIIDEEEALQALDQMFVECRQGAMQFASITGPSGSGKTSIVRTFITSAEQSGAITLPAVGSEFDMHAGMSVVSQLLRADAICPKHSENVDDLILDMGHLAKPSLLGRSLLLLTDILLHLLTRAPAVVVVVDDAHQADPDSMRCLSLVAKRLWRHPVVMIFTDTLTEGTHLPHVESTLLAGPQVIRVRCRLFSEASVRAFLSAHLGPHAAAPLAAEWHQISGGNPLLLRAMLDDHLRAGMSRLPADRPGPAFIAAVQDRLLRSGLRVRDLAQTLVTLGESTPLHVLGRVLDVEPTTIPRMTQALENVGLLADGRFRHPAIKAAVASSMTPALRLRTHRRAAAALHDEGSPIAAVADQLVRAADNWMPDSECCNNWEAQVLLEAAGDCRALRRIDEALRYLRAAFHICGDARWKASILAAQAAWEWEQSPTTVGRHLGEMEAAATRGLLCYRQSRILIKELLHRGRVTRVLRTLDRISGDQDAGDDLTLISRWVAVNMPGVLSARQEFIPQPPTPASLSSAFGDPHDFEDLAVNLLHGVLTRSLDEDEAHLIAEYVLRACLTSEQPPDVAEMAIYVLMYVDKASLAAAWCDRLLEDAQAHNLTTRASVFAALRAEAALRQGFLKEAVGFAERALDGPAQPSSMYRRGQALAAWIAATVGGGAVAAAAVLLRDRLPGEVPRSRWELHYLHARGHYLLSTGQATAALGDFRACGELMQRWNMDLPSLVPWRLEIARTYLAMGKPEKAKAPIDEHMNALLPGRSRARGMALRTFAALQKPRERCSLLIDAVDQLLAAGDHREAACALAELSRAQADRGQLERARLTARQANEETARCDAGPSETTPLQPGLHAIGEPRPPEDVLGGGGVLSEAEYRVAALAARGVTNREIARELFITQSTVEQHLTRVYRKLSVRQRSQLSRKLQLLDASSQRAAIS